MQVKLVKIGNSFGIRLPKAVIESCGFSSDLELTVKGRSIILTSTKQPRQGWQEAVRDEISAKPLRYLGEWEW